MEYREGLVVIYYGKPPDLLEAKRLVGEGFPGIAVASTDSGAIANLLLWSTQETRILWMQGTDNYVDIPKGVEVFKDGRKE